ncbi:hypothetical protein Patl1_04185 [Pistacia atlantica]|uniref:Uncharacterized protein n=1 Tax=Pistacia atlantica TaxID=434234 RepID=A0ACC1BVD3_9ROSI|nr:hypothetical protein Patl1_04185 [Pistacia atlantica]
MSEVLKIDDFRELDRNFAVDGEENAEVHGKSHSVPTEFDQDNAGRTNIDYDQERTQSPSNGKHYQGEMDELSGSYFQKSSFEFKAQTLHDERGTEGSAHPQESPLTADSNQVEEPECNPDEMEGQTIEHQAEKLSSYSRSPSGDGEGEPRNEKYNSSKNSPSDTGQLDLSHSISHSPGSTHRRSASPVTVNQMLVSPEGSPHLHLSPNGHRPSLPLQEGVQDELHSRTQHKQKHAASPERRRCSPRQRSPPGYHSRHHSPRQRPWSPPPNRKTGVGKPGKNLFVAGFSFLTTERDLERKFSRFGRVQDVRIVRDKRSGDSRGFGFLSLETDEDADAAIRALDETEWNGRVILVEKSKSTR